MKHGVACLLAVSIMLVASGADFAQESPTSISGSGIVEPDLLIEDFDSGLPLGQDEFGNQIGFVPWGDSPENVVLSAVQLIAYSELALPQQAEHPNTVLAIHYNIDEWGGFTQVFNDGSNWITQDWHEYNAMSLWLYGNETGGTVQIEIFDNRSPHSDGDTAERFFYRVTDDYTGWRQFTIPFDLFARRTDWQPDGAPDDGLGLTAVSGYAVGFPAGADEQVAYIDQVGLATAEDISAVMIGAVVEEGDVVDLVTWDSRRWNLVWSDEFDGEAGIAINEQYWTHELGGSGWGNNELQFYTNLPENVSLDGNGNLAIVAREDHTRSHACHYGLCRYTSARIVTRDKVEFTYGRIEGRIRVPRGQGLWPAFWMLGANIQQVPWPASGEIDIMENLGREPRIVHGTIHGPGYSGSAGIGSPYHIDQDFADDFHIYAVDWDPNAIRWYVDGELYNTLTPDDLRGQEWVFDHDFFIILNVAVGGYWPGNPDDTTEFPQTMLVDYIRVYELE